MNGELILPTPFGAPLRLRSRDGTIVACEFVPRARRSAAPPSDPLLREARAQLERYFRKRLLRFDLPLHFEGTPLQIAIWSFVAQLETGEVISYGDVARVIGAPGRHRAVASAMGRTPFDLLVPAHRVIGSDGTLKGAAPNSMRRRLLAFEGITL